MKIALSSRGKDLKSNIDLRFGRAKYFIIYDLGEEDFKAVDNDGYTASGGAGIASAQQLIDASVNCAVSGSFGPNAYDLLKASDIKMYQGKEISIEDLIESYKDGELKEIKAPGSSKKGRS